MDETDELLARQKAEFYARPDAKEIEADFNLRHGDTEIKPQDLPSATRMGVDISPGAGPSTYEEAATMSPQGYEQTAATDPEQSACENSLRLAWGNELQQNLHAATGVLVELGKGDRELLNTIAYDLGNDVNVIKALHSLSEVDAESEGMTPEEFEFEGKREVAAMRGRWGGSFDTKARQMSVLYHRLAENNPELISKVMRLSFDRRLELYDVAALIGSKL